MRPLKLVKGIVGKCPKCGVEYGVPTHDGQQYLSQAQRTYDHALRLCVEWAVDAWCNYSPDDEHIHPKLKENMERLYTLYYLTGAPFHPQTLEKSYLDEGIDPEDVQELIDKAGKSDGIS